MRKRIAERMVESLLHTAPHVTTVFEADLSAIIAHRAAHKEDFQRRGAVLTFTSYFLAACVDAIREVHLGAGAEHLQVLDQVPGEGVVVVDDEDAHA